MLKEHMFELEQNRQLRSETEVAAFETALKAVAVAPDPGQLDKLHLVFDDNCVHHEVMFGLVHLLETFDMVAQLRSLLRILPDLQKRAPEWSLILHTRILNAPAARKCYRALLSKATGPSHDAGMQQLRRIASEREEPLKGFAISAMGGG